MSVWPEGKVLNLPSKIRGGMYACTCGDVILEMTIIHVTNNAVYHLILMYLLFFIVIIIVLFIIVIPCFKGVIWL